MPLVEVTCNLAYFPKDNATRHSPTQQFTIDLVKELPSLIAGNATKLGLKPEDTPQGGVQVTIEKFHSHAQNIPDVGIFVQFVEPYPGKKRAKKVRNRFEAIVRNQMPDADLRSIQIAFDLFWGPGHGHFIANALKKPILSW